MYRPILAWTLVICTLLLCRAAPAAEPLAPRTEWIPRDAVIVVDIAQPQQLLDQLLDDRVTKAVTAAPQYQAATDNPEFKQLVGLVKYYQEKYEVDLRGLAGKLLGGGVTWAIGPKEANLLIVDTQDAKLLEEVHEFLRVVTRGEAEKRGQANPITSAEYRGLTGWRFGPDEAHAIVGNRLLLTNKPDWLKAAADLKADGSDASVAKSPNFCTARAAIGANAVASIYADLALLKQIPQLQTALSKNGENPLASLLFAPVLAALRESNWLAIGAGIEGRKLVFEAALDGTPSDASSLEGFSTPATAQGGAMPNFAVPRQIASLSFYRDLHQFYAAKDKLFPERTSGLIFFENMMGIFFTGRDLTDEVLAETTPEVRFVVAEQQYDPKVGTPQVQLPGFAVVLRMKNPDKFAPVAEEAFQKALGLVNFTRGQAAQPGLIIDRPMYGDVKYTVAAFAPPSQPSESPVGMHVNFQPTLAMPKGYLIISSAEGLARDLIDALKEEAAGNVQPLAGMHSLLTVDGSRVASILNANRENLILQNMVEKGNTREQAAAGLDMGLKIGSAIRQVSLSMGNRDGQTRVKLEIAVEVP
jgi:hypothetical protein